MADAAVLLVEGPEDRHVVTHLCRHHRISVCDRDTDEGIRIKDKNGYDNLRKTLDVELDASGLEYLGVVVDADTDLHRRWVSLRDKLHECGYNQLPDTPDPNGAIISQEAKPTVGIWIMPDNSITSGMLEHFVSFLVPDGDRLWPYAMECVDRIAEHERPFPEQHLRKAHIHTWLAWQKEPGVPFGLAITKKYLNADASHAHRLIDWLRRLFPHY
jgi:hypothetical protein